MDSHRFARVFAALVGSPTRRRLLPALAVAGATALRLVPNKEAVEASNNGKRRRRRRARLRQRCVNACGGTTCDLCVYATTGEINCAAGAIAACGEDCQSNDDCTGVAHCMTAAQEVGSARKERFCGGNFSHGLCTLLNACPPP